MTAPSDHLHDGPPTTHDAFLGGALHLRQPQKGYRAGLDAVLLAAFVPPPAAGHSARLLDVGSGVGTVGLCAAVRLPALDVTLIEQNPQLCRLAADNIEANGLANRARVIERDIASQAAAHPELADSSFDTVVSNPPFYDASNHRASPNALKAAAHAMPDAGLDAWARYMARMTRPGGTAIVIHRADHLAPLLAAFGPRFGAISLLPLHPRQGALASRIIMRGTKGNRAALTIAPGITLHGPDGRFTPMIDLVLKTPGPLDYELRT